MNPNSDMRAYRQGFEDCILLIEREAKRGILSTKEIIECLKASANKTWIKEEVST